MGAVLRTRHRGRSRLMVLVGENEKMPLGKFFLYKMAAMAVLALCIYIGKRLRRAGLLPTKIYEEIEEDEI